MPTTALFIGTPVKYLHSFNRAEIKSARREVLDYPMRLMHLLAPLEDTFGFVKIANRR